ncbi:hypothetical protein EKO04_003399 [Ascochyta lentis]|uniref:Uncharacterized protein n=1 Tax=Ascochyta lentis TaxID=205686 RepID=A0A8H7J801_9PLEO|nr:hypothetical protein EKO04_003399 [Ascochyta lentis]
MSGVKLSHLNLIAEAVLTGDMFKSWISTSRPDFEYRTIAHLPIAHIAGIQGHLINPFYGQHRNPFFITVPPIYLPIAKSALATNQSPTHEHAISAAPLGKHPSTPPANPQLPISQTWGPSESTDSATLQPTTFPPRTPHPHCHQTQTRILNLNKPPTAVPPSTAATCYSADPPTVFRIPRHAPRQRQYPKPPSPHERRGLSTRNSVHRPLRTST